MDQVDGALLEHAGAHAALDVVAAPRFENHAVDALAKQEVRQKEARRARADDPDLCAHGVPNPAATIRCGLRRFQPRNRKDN